MAAHVRRVWQVARVNGTCEAQIQIPISCHFLRKRRRRVARSSDDDAGAASAFCHGRLRARILTRAFINAKSLESPNTLLTFKDA